MILPAAKLAQLASGIGAIVLGVGIGAWQSRTLLPYAIYLLIAGAAVHGIGMSLEYRWEHGDAGPTAWERALLWMCWALLALLFVGAAVVLRAG